LILLAYLPFHQFDYNMASQYALQVLETGKPVVIVTRPIPIPGEGEIVVKVMAAGSKHIKDAYYLPSYYI
jgi:Zn-dependent alcohol dehydrogenase